MCTHVHRAFKNYFTKVILKRSCLHLKMLNAQKKKKEKEIKKESIQTFNIHASM